MTRPGIRVPQASSRFQEQIRVTQRASFQRPLKPVPVFNLQSGLMAFLKTLVGQGHQDFSETAIIGPA